MLEMGERGGERGGEVIGGTILQNNPTPRFGFPSISVRVRLLILKLFGQKIVYRWGRKINKIYLYFK